MRRGLLIYTGLIISLFLGRFYPVLDFLPFLYMLAPMLLLPDERLGLGNYRRGFLYGSLFLPLMLFFPPDLSCPSWLLNQLGVATAEEIFFRGYLMEILGNVRTSVLFSLAHLVNYPNVNSLLTFFPSLIFGYAYQRSGSILAPTLLHFTANLIYSSMVKEFPQLYHLLQRELTGG